MNYQLKPEYLTILKKDTQHQIALVNFTKRSIITISNVVRGNLPLLVDVGVLIFLRDRIAPGLPIESLIEEKAGSAEKARAGVEL